MSGKADILLWSVSIAGAILLHVGLAVAVTARTVTDPPAPPPFRISIATVDGRPAPDLAVPKIAAAVAVAPQPPHAPATIAPAKAIPLEAEPIKAIALTPPTAATTVAQATATAPPPARATAPAPAFPAAVPARVQTAGSVAAARVASALDTAIAAAPVAATSAASIVEPLVANVPPASPKTSIFAQAPASAVAVSEHMMAAPAAQAAAATVLAPQAALPVETATGAAQPVDVVPAIAPQPLNPDGAESASELTAVGPVAASPITVPVATASALTEPTVAVAATVPPLVVASIPVAPVIVSQPDPNVASVRRFLAGYDGGSCFTAMPEAGEDGQLTLSAYVGEASDMTALEAALGRVFPSVPALITNTVAPAQCDALALAQRLGSSSGPEAAVRLSRTQVTNGTVLDGTVEHPAGTDLHLLIVDDDGLVSNADRYLSDIAGTGRFAAPVVITGESGSRLQLVVAVVSDQPIHTFPDSEGAPAADYFRALADELQHSSTPTTLAIAAFSVH